MARPDYPNSRGFTSSSTSSSMISLPDNFHHRLTLAPEIPQYEIENISVSSLLEKDALHQGFVYKRAADKKTDKVTVTVENMLPMKFLSKWQLRYLVIYSHYVVYYKDDTSKKPVGWFSLRNYNRVVRAEEMVSVDRKWPFKVIGMRAAARTWNFCAASEREMRLWMACFKATMDHGIHGKVKQTCLDIITFEQSRCNPIGGSAGDESQFSASSTGDRFINDKENYEDLESPTTSDRSCDSNYDDIDADTESESSGSGGMIHPPLSPVQSAENYDTPDLSMPSTAELDNLRKNLSRSAHSNDTLPPLPPTTSRHSPAPHINDRLPPLPSPPSRVIPALRPLMNSPRLPPKPESRGLRREPDGNSFREPAFQERVHVQSRKPDILPPKPTRAAKPLLSPKPVARVKVMERDKPIDLLPKSAILDTTDKSYAELFLRKHEHDGMYLIRGSSRDPSRKVIMVWHAQINKSRHYTIFGHQSSSFALDNCTQFTTLIELIEYYKKNFLPTSDLKLSIPCPS